MAIIFIFLHIKMLFQYKQKSGFKKLFVKKWFYKIIRS